MKESVNMNEWVSELVFCKCGRIEPVWPGGVTLNAWQKNGKNNYDVKCPACGSIITIEIDIEN